MNGATIFQMVSGLGDAFEGGYDAARKREQEEAAPALFEKMLGLGSGSGAPAPGGMDAVAAGYKTGTPAAPSFAATGGGMGDYLASTRARESGGNDLAANPNSTAKGRYQFTDSTWADVARKHPDLGLQPGGWRDPAQQEKAMTAFTADNAKFLGERGIPINPGNLYGAHFLGADGAARFIPAAINSPDQPAIKFVAPGSVRANRTVFFGADGRPKTAGEVYAWMGGPKPSAAPAATPTFGPAVASADADAANRPAPGAVPAGFQIPGQDSAPAAPAAPAATPALAGAGSGLSRFSPDQIATLRAAYANPNTRSMATSVLSAMLTGKDRDTAVVGNQLVDKRTGQVIFTGPDKPQTVSPGSALVGADGRVVYQAPDRDSDKLQSVAPGTTLYDPRERAPVFTAPAKPEAFTLAPGQTRYEGSQPVASAPDRDRTFDSEAKLRGEFSKQLGQFNDVQDAYGRVISAVSDRETNPKSLSPASDIALVFGYMKMLDPGSVVREGEYATAKNAAGVPEQVVNTYNKLVSGEFLTPVQRQDFVDTAGRVYGQARQIAEGTAARYRDLAPGQGLDEGRVVALPGALAAPKVSTNRPDSTGETPKADTPTVQYGQKAIPMQALNALRSDPNLREQFDAWYGRGASDRILGPVRAAPKPAPSAGLDPSLGLQ